MFGTIVFFLGVLTAIVGAVVAFKLFSSGEPGAGLFAILVTFLLGGGMILGSTITIVDTKKVGVVTSFKKPTGEIREAGAGLIAPWESVTEMDAAKQTEPYQFNVQLAGGATATLDIFPSWRMDPNAAPELFQDFKTFEAVIASLFKQQLVSTANNIFANYNPLTDVDPVTGQLKKDKATWGKELKAALEQNALIKGRLIIENISIPTIAPDKNTQENLNKVIAEFARGKVLEQQKVNAEKQKAITETNAKVDKQTRCLEIAAANGGQPGICLNGSSGVIINTNK